MYAVNTSHSFIIMFYHSPFTENNLQLYIEYRFLSKYSDQFSKCRDFFIFFLDGRCFLVARSVSTPLLRTRMTDRKQICPNGRASTVTDALARSCKWQMPFSGRGVK